MSVCGLCRRSGEGLAYSLNGGLWDGEHIVGICVECAMCIPEVTAWAERRAKEYEQAERTREQYKAMCMKMARELAKHDLSKRPLDGEPTAEEDEMIRKAIQQSVR